MIHGLLKNIFAIHSHEKREEKISISTTKIMNRPLLLSKCKIKRRGMDFANLLHFHDEFHQILHYYMPKNVPVL